MLRTKLRDAGFVNMDGWMVTTAVSLMELGKAEGLTRLPGCRLGPLPPGTGDRISPGGFDDFYSRPDWRMDADSREVVFGSDNRR